MRTQPGRVLARRLLLLIAAVYAMTMSAAEARGATITLFTSTSTRYGYGDTRDPYPGETQAPVPEPASLLLLDGTACRRCTPSAPVPEFALREWSSSAAFR